MHTINVRINEGPSVKSAASNLPSCSSGDVLGEAPPAKSGHDTREKKPGYTFLPDEDDEQGSDSCLNSDMDGQESDDGDYEFDDHEVDNEGEPSGGATADHVPVDPDHIYWWLLRTNRKSQCNGCGECIQAYEWKYSFYPGPEMIADFRVWRRVWWKFYHANRDCVLRHHDQRELFGTCVASSCVLLEGVFALHP